MKKLSKNQKNAILIGGGALAILALSSFSSNGTPEKPKIEIIGFDPDAMQVHYTLNGANRKAPINYTQTFPISKGYGIKTERPVYGIMKFYHTHNNQVISELASVNVSQYHYEPAPAYVAPGGTSKG